MKGCKVLKLFQTFYKHVDEFLKDFKVGPPSFNIMVTNLGKRKSYSWYFESWNGKHHDNFSDKCKLCNNFSWGRFCGPYKVRGYVPPNQLYKFRIAVF